MKNIATLFQKDEYLLNLDALAYILSLIQDNAREAYAEAMQDKKDDFKSGRLLAYYEVLDTIQNQLTTRGVNLQDLGLQDADWMLKDS